LNVIFLNDRRKELMQNIFRQHPISIGAQHHNPLSQAEALTRKYHSALAGSSTFSDKDNIVGLRLAPHRAVSILSFVRAASILKIKKAKSYVGGTNAWNSAPIPISRSAMEIVYDR